MEIDSMTIENVKKLLKGYNDAKYADIVVNVWMIHG